jgi:hypothetical protein
MKAPIISYQKLVNQKGLLRMTALPKFLKDLFGFISTTHLPRNTNYKSCCYYHRMDASGDKDNVL